MRRHPTKAQLAKLEEFQAKELCTVELLEVLFARLRYTNGIEFVSKERALSLISCIAGQLATLEEN